ncbi:MAG TPA: ATP-binding cassette domain-containing protein [Rhodanobacter sp.]
MRSDNFSGNMDIADAVIRCDNVRKEFVRDGNRTLAVDGLSFTVARGEYVCVVGRTGHGKSTLVNLLLGLLPASAGTVEVLGRDPYRQFDQLKGRLSCIFQGDRLLPWRTVLANVRLPLEILGIRERTLPLHAMDWLKRLGLQEVPGAYPHELSGGMRQRVAMARALVSDPEVVLADEAFAHLDAVTGDRIKSDFRQLMRSSGKTVIHITHSIEEATTLADRIIVLGEHGRIRASFRADSVHGAHAIDELRHEIYRQVANAERPALSVVSGK